MTATLSLFVDVLDIDEFDRIALFLERPSSRSNDTLSLHALT